MKKLISLVIFLFVLYLGVQYGYKKLVGGHTITYKIEKDNNVFVINEVYSRKSKNDKSVYRFELNVNNDTTFAFRTDKNFNDYEHIIKDVKYIKTDKHECIAPIFRDNEIIFDVLCKEDNDYAYYSNLSSKDNELNLFVDNLIKEGYKYHQWVKDDEATFDNDSKTTIYKNNISTNHHIALRDYKGLNIVDKNRINHVTLFEDDVYESSLSIMMDEYFIIVDYNANHDFYKFFVVNVTNNNLSTITYNSKISFDGYFQGAVDNKVYFYDRSNKRQYRIDPINLTVVQVGNIDTGVQNYVDEKWETINAYEPAKKDYIFDTSNKIIDEVKNNRFYRIDLIGSNKTGNYYFYEKKNNKIIVYKADIEKPNYLIKILETSKIDHIKYTGNSLYFVNGKTIYAYNDYMGLNKVIESDEYEFNKNNIYNVYSEN